MQELESSYEYIIYEIKTIHKRLVFS